MQGAKSAVERGVQANEDLFASCSGCIPAGDKVFCGPVVVYNYPKDIKAFYMKLNEDEKTVQAMDVLVPGIGEVIGGSAREDRLDILDMRIQEMKLEIEAYWWYRDLRKYGGVPHCGFGLGFERLIMMTTGVGKKDDEKK